MVSTIVNKTRLQQKIGEMLKPSVRSLFKSIYSLLEMANIMRASKVDETLEVEPYKQFHLEYHEGKHHSHYTVEYAI